MAHISVVLPTYNRADTFRRAIGSVLAPSFEDWELIIVNHDSENDTKDVFTGIDPHIRLFVQENQGMVGACSAGLAQMHGDLIAFLDSDDEMLPCRLALVAAFFAEFPGEHIYTSEFWESFGPGGYGRHFWLDASKWYTDMARVFGSKTFAERVA